MEIVPGALNYQSIINSWNASNVTVTGSGVIDGQGQPWWERCTASAQTVSSVSASHRTVILQSSCSRPLHTNGLVALAGTRCHYPPPVGQWPHANESCLEAGRPMLLQFTWVDGLSVYVLCRSVASVASVASV
eukprot:COSAG03_NODE_6399_length_1065_cov_848.946170_1_plen_132_part_10